MNQRKVVVDGVWEDVVRGAPPFVVGQRVTLSRPGQPPVVYVCTEISTDTIVLRSGLATLDLASRFEAALWS